MSFKIVKSGAIAFLMGTLALCLSSNVMANCTGDFYVVVMDADSSPNLRVRSKLVDKFGTTDFIGNITLPSSALGGQNTLYQFNLLAQAYMDNSKLTISTDGDDCVIDFSDKFLGNILDVQSADF